MRRRRRDRGSGTLLVVFVALVLTVLGAGVGVWARTSIAEHRTAATADLLALDAAAVVRDGGDGCAFASRRVSGAGATGPEPTARLVDCQRHADRIRLVVGVDVPLGRWGSVPVRVAAEAGQEPG